MCDSTVVLNFERKSDFVSLEAITNLLLVLFLFLLVLFIFGLVVIDPRDDESSLVPVVGELRQKILSCWLMKSLIKLVLVNIQ